MVNWLISGAEVADGSLGPLKRANVAIKDGRIRVLSPTEHPPAERTLDATNHIVAPGLIDVHSHNDLVAVAGSCLGDKITQGVTTEVVGNCGYSPFPITQKNSDILGELLEIIAPGKWRPNWRTWSDFAEATNRAGCQANLVGQVGHAMLRSGVLGMDMRKPSSSEVDEMQHLLSKCLNEGASGLSFGLMYHPSGFAQREEIAALCAVAADHHAFVSVHLRSYSATGLLPGMEEMISIAEQTGARLLLSHLSPTGRHSSTVLPEMLTSVEAAQVRGLDVAFDRYPYEHAYSRLSLLVPQWALAGGTDAMVDRLHDTELVTTILAQIDRFVADVGYDCIQLSGVSTGRYRDRTLASIAENTGRTPARCVVEILEELGTAAPIVLKLSDMPTQRRILAHESCMVGSDGIPCLGGTHPRTFGTFSRILGSFVRGGTLSLPQALHKMTGQPASWLGLKDRGVVRDGAVADLIVFDSAKIEDRSTFENPYAPSVGIHAVFVGGEPAVLGGEMTGNMGGQTLTCRAEKGGPTTPLQRETPPKACGSTYRTGSPK